MVKILERAKAIEKMQEELKAEIIAALYSADAPNKTLRHGLDVYTSEFPIIKIYELEKHLDVDMRVWL